MVGDRHVVVCLAGLLRSDSPLHVRSLNALTSLAEDSEQDDDPAARLPEADPPRSAIERHPEFVDVISILEFLDVIAIWHTAGDEKVIDVPHDPLVVAVGQVEQPCLHLRLQVDLVHGVDDIYH